MKKKFVTFALASAITISSVGIMVSAAAEKEGIL